MLDGPELEEKLKAILVETGGGDTMSYSLAIIIEAMRRAYVLGAATWD